MAGKGVGMGIDCDRAFFENNLELNIIEILAKYFNKK